MATRRSDHQAINLRVSVLGRWKFARRSGDDGAFKFANEFCLLNVLFATLGAKMKRTRLVTAVVVVLICVNLFSVASVAQNSRYTPEEVISGTQWSYSEFLVNKLLNQCRVQLETQAINGSRSILDVSVLSKGSLVFAIKDSDWKNQINSVFGWSVGKEFDEVLLHLKDGRLPTKANIPLPEVFLIWLPKDQEILLKAFFCDRRVGCQRRWFGLQGLEIAWTVESMQKLKRVNY
jgi:hypothetical protein